MGRMGMEQERVGYLGRMSAVLIAVLALWASAALAAPAPAEPAEAPTDNRAQQPATMQSIRFVKVEAPAPFYVSRHEITRREYELFLAALASGEYRHERCLEPNCSRSHRPVRPFPKDAGGAPATNVRWLDAYAFCKWLGPEYRLPSRDHYRTMMTGIAIEGVPKTYRDRAAVLPSSVATERRTGGFGICGLTENVDEFTADDTKDMAAQGRGFPPDKVYTLYLSADLKQYVFVPGWPRDGVDEGMGFRVVKVR